MHKTLLLAPALALIAMPLSAQSLTRDLIERLRSEGFTRIEIDRNASTTEVEAIRGSQKVELLVDNATREILRRETGPVDDDDDTRPGVEIDDRNDDRNDDRDDDRGDDRDDDRDDDRGDRDDDDRNDDDRDNDRGDRGDDDDDGDDDGDD
ncbi:PepSY domain-containing protein [Frigidibacter oleivorans]|uniref:PepSY domain-containing protein n=1 Tax=Frigidibacter oleivorans TaxID=2487129 RepID=UPI000F8F517D|nr:PepSY domain-containing protein [Frigidibacter oleivorans]